MHQISPNAEIVFNKCVFAFNLWNQYDFNGNKIVNITEMSDKDIIPVPGTTLVKWGSLNLPANSAKTIYNFAMDKIKKIITSNFKCVVWNDLDNQENKIITDLSKNNIYQNEVNDWANKLSTADKSLITEPNNVSLTNYQDNKMLLTTDQDKTQQYLFWLFQKDLGDIHPKKFAYALLDQNLYDNLITKQINTTWENFNFDGSDTVDPDKESQAFI